MCVHLHVGLNLFGSNPYLRLQNTTHIENFTYNCHALTQHTKFYLKLIKDSDNYASWGTN